MNLNMDVKYIVSSAVNLLFNQFSNSHTETWY